MASLPRLKDVVKVKGKDLKEVRAGLDHLASHEVLVGFPEDTTAREDLGVDGITNAALGYIHDNGQPEVNIPARPFMIPAITEVQAQIASQLGAVGRRILQSKQALVADQGLHRLGLMVVTAIKRKINEGIPPPLADLTLRRRAKSEKGGKSAKFEMERRAQGLAPSTEYAKPLVHTGALRNSVNYVIRPRKDRK